MGSASEALKQDLLHKWAWYRRGAQRGRELINSSVFSPSIDHRNVYFWSALTELVIHVRDLCEMADECGRHLGWKDDLVPWETFTPDVVITSMIRFVRYA